MVGYPSATATINDRLQAIGTGRAKASVTVNPYATGRLIAITAASGSHVTAGQEIARLNSDTEEIAVDRAKVALQDAQSKYDRAKSLRATNTTSAVALADAEVALSNARLELRDAELALQRRSIVAPIAGIIGIVPVEVGNYVNAQTTIAMIDDRSSILVDFWVPERFADAVKVGADVSATPVANIKDALKGHGVGRRQPHRRQEPHHVGAGLYPQPERCVARRHVVQSDDDFPGRHLSGGQPARDSMGR